MDIQKRFRLVDDYEKIINYITVTFSQEETTVINNCEIGSEKDSMKKTYANEMRKVLAEMVSDYYTTESFDKLAEYKDVLTKRLENNPVGESVTTEVTARNQAIKDAAQYIETILNIEKRIEMQDKAAREK